MEMKINTEIETISGNQDIQKGSVVNVETPTTPHKIRKDHRTFLVTEDKEYRSIYKIYLVSMLTRFPKWKMRSYSFDDIESARAFCQCWVDCFTQTHPEFAEYDVKGSLEEGTKYYIRFTDGVHNTMGVSFSLACQHVFQDTTDALDFSDII